MRRERPGGLDASRPALPARSRNSRCQCSTSQRCRGQGREHSTKPVSKGSHGYRRGKAARVFHARELVRPNGLFSAAARINGILAAHSVGVHVRSDDRIPKGLPIRADSGSQAPRQPQSDRKRSHMCCGGTGWTWRNGYSSVNSTGTFVRVLKRTFGKKRPKPPVGLG